MVWHFVKRAFMIAAALAVVVFGSVWALKLWWDAHYFAGYDATAALDTQILGEEERDGYHRVAFSFDGLPGEKVPSLLALPQGSAGPFPCIIFLHGIGQNKGFLDVIASRYTSNGFAIASYDQYTRGERDIKNDNVFNGAAGLRRRGAMNVIDTRRMVDYLVTRPDIDPDRIYLLGASYGAITGANAAAFEPRIKAVVLSYGGGDLHLLLASDTAKEQLGPLAGPVIWLASALFKPADPIGRIAAIAPRPLLVQNGENDTVVPPASGKALFEAAGEPKEFVLYPGDHIGLDEDMVWRILDDTITWFKRVDSQPGIHSEAD